MTYAVLCGGGTAGHVIPALVVADALVAAGHDRSEVHYVGARRGLEAKLLPGTGFPFTLLDLRSMPRRVTPQNVLAAIKLAGGLGRAIALLRRLRPRVVVSVGGYASVPTVAAAVVLRIPIVVVSWDVVPGVASRLAARFARASAVAFESSSLPRRIVTGAPIRPEVAAIDRQRDRVASRAILGLPADRFTVLVFGGSQGSGALNAAVDQFVADNPERRDLAIRHIVGDRNAGDDRRSTTPADGLVRQVVAYEEQMAVALAAADLVVARAGAGTVAELAAAAVASILVPWPEAAEDHQSANAKVLADAGAAIVIPESSFNADALRVEIDRFRANPAALRAAGEAARGVGRPNAAAAIAEVVDRWAR